MYCTHGEHIGSPEHGIVHGFCRRSTATFLIPLYHQVPTVLDGVLAVCGAVVLSREMFDISQINALIPAPA
ncbi:MAG: hypothetical protein ABSE07_07505 [Methanoregula sp.]